jgi:hypothetical protein
MIPEMPGMKTDADCRDAGVLARCVVSTAVLSVLAKALR